MKKIIQFSLYLASLLPFSLLSDESLKGCLQSLNPSSSESVRDLSLSASLPMAPLASGNSSESEISSNSLAESDRLILCRHPLKEEPSLFYWDARPQHGFSNFGDALSEALVERIIGHKVQVASKPFQGPRKLLGMGSIMSYAQDHDLIWGTGVNGKAPENSYRFTTLDVRAVRGPLTRDFLLKRGIDCPEVYGDPTLLLPIYFPEFQKSANPSHDFIIIPHFSDEDLFLDIPNRVSVKEPWYVVVEKILDSKFVIASALSGIIVAEAFGIPARLLQIENKSNTEDLFKYKDYYYGTNRFTFSPASSLEEALKMGGEPLPVCNLEKLRLAFPFESFETASVKGL